MPEKELIALIYSLRSSAEAALGEVNSPMLSHLAKDGILARRTAEKSIRLLEVLQQKTLGNLDDTEQDVLLEALQALRKLLAQKESLPQDIPMSPSLSSKEVN
ncbi:MAG: DUF1844 domain-containing protein [Deinococcales bacterium]